MMVIYVLEKVLVVKLLMLVLIMGMLVVYVVL